MINKAHRIPCMIIRGGTSKGLYFLERDLPSDTAQRDELLLNIMGSPDAKQINGLGGATSVTSKVAIVGVSSRPDADVDYTFCQVSVDKPLVSTKGNCGNISSGVGPFAIENGSVKYDGDFAIAGVPEQPAPLSSSLSARLVRSRPARQKARTYCLLEMLLIRWMFPALALWKCPSWMRQTRWSL